jgi:PKHD-type hydroxylase
MFYDYWFWKKLYDAKKIKDINKFITNNYHSLEPSELAATNKDGSKKKFLTTKLISWAKIKPIFSSLEEDVHHINKYHFGYDIDKIFEADDCNYNIYSSVKKNTYNWHIDCSRNVLMDMKFTVLINLSEKKYTGGDFLIFNNVEYVVKEFNEPGDVLMFKSYLNHKVTPVLTGERRTLAIFVYGPRFK